MKKDNAPAWFGKKRRRLILTLGQCYHTESILPCPRPCGSCSHHGDVLAEYGKPTNTRSFPRTIWTPDRSRPACLCAISKTANYVRVGLGLMTCENAWACDWRQDSAACPMGS